MPKITTEVGVKRTCDNSYSANTSNKKWIGGDSVIERYKVVNCQRSQDTLNEEKSEDKWMTLIDVEDSWSVSGTAKQNVKESEVSYIEFYKNTLICNIIYFLKKDLKY